MVAHDPSESAALATAVALLATLAARDRFSAEHSAVVAVYARDLAAKLELPPGAQHLARISGLVHDVGKIGLPAGILEKQAPLSVVERGQLEAHSVIGERILSQAEGLGEIARIVRHHHERWDGGGYPDGLAGEATPLPSRVVAVANAWAWWTCACPTSGSLSSSAALARLRDEAGARLDPRLVAAFDELLAAAAASYRNGTAPEFGLERAGYPAGWATT